MYATLVTLADLAFSIGATATQFSSRKKSNCSCLNQEKQKNKFILTNSLLDYLMLVIFNKLCFLQKVALKKKIILLFNGWHFIHKNYFIIEPTLNYTKYCILHYLSHIIALIFYNPSVNHLMPSCFKTRKYLSVWSENVHDYLLTWENLNKSKKKKKYKYI